MLDPALGDGSLLEAMGRRLLSRGISHFELHGLDTDSDAVARAEVRLKARFDSRKVVLRAADFLGEIAAKSSLVFDAVIANPPYVRTQVLGARFARGLASRFGLRGRVDLYHAFLLAIGDALGEGGCAGLIVSNRLLTTKSGAGVRDALLGRFEVLHVWDLGDTRLFGAAVLPALLFLRKNAHSARNRLGPFSSMYSAPATATARDCSDAVAALAATGTVRLPDGRYFHVRHGLLAADGVWRLTSPETEAWLRTVDAHTACRFGDVGKVRVGVKTTADRVFIRSDWDQLPDSERPELLRPLLTHHDARRYRAAPGSTPRMILYPYHSANGRRQVLDLADYPRTRRYLERHRPLLERREYVRRAGRRWYEIWVPQDPAGWAAPKLVFRDISESPVFWLDLRGSVVNGDCYWLNPRGGNADLLWLALGVANAKFIETYYDCRFHNKLYAGRRRFITQYVELFPLPSPEAHRSKEIVHLSKTLYAVEDGEDISQVEAELNLAVWRAFGLRAGEAAF